MFKHVSHELPNLMQENTEGSRLYVTPNGDKYPSVTTVLSEYGKKQLFEWKARVGEEHANKVSRIATTRGTSVHKVIETYLNNDLISQDDLFPNVKSLYVRMKPELDKLDNIHCLETRMFSNELKLAGTVDCIAEYNGVLSVIDFKTSVRLKKKENVANYFMQGTAYSVMFEEMTGLKPEQIVIMIGVDSANFCQVLKVKPTDYRDELQKYIDKYYGVKSV